MTVRVLVADDHEVVRAGLRKIFADSEIKVVAEATTGAEAVTMAQQQSLDLVILDVVMPDMDGLTALEKLKANRPDLPVLMLSSYENPSYVARSVALGASGFLVKRTDAHRLRTAVTTAARQGPIWTHDDLRRVAHAMASPHLDVGNVTPLSEREADVLRRVAGGMSNKEIAAVLDISYETVKEHVQRILRKLVVSDRTQAAIWAVRNEIA